MTLPSSLTSTLVESFGSSLSPSSPLSIRTLIATRSALHRLNPVIVGKNCVLKSNTRLLSGAQMSDFSIMQEHTLVLAGDTVDSGSVWQGWPSNNITPLEIYRKNVIHLVDKAVFRSSSADHRASAKRQQDRQDQQYEMIEESKRQRADPLRSLKLTEDQLSSANQKRVSFKTTNSSTSPTSSLASSAARSPAKGLSKDDSHETTPLLKK
jgi:carbonic anhydrase/acetyltransferase-like protein (isoleucine patch superfamily)